MEINVSSNLLSHTLDMLTLASPVSLSIQPSHHPSAAHLIN